MSSVFSVTSGGDIFSSTYILVTSLEELLLVYFSYLSATPTNHILHLLLSTTKHLLVISGQQSARDAKIELGKPYRLNMSTTVTLGIAQFM